MASPTPKSARAVAEEIIETVTTMGDRVDLMEAIVRREFRARAPRVKGEARRCPCEWVEPCKPNCSCAHPYLSAGCQRCCTYGSEEQQRTAATIIAARDTRARRIEEAAQKYVAVIDGIDQDTGTTITSGGVRFYATLKETKRGVRLALAGLRAALADPHADAPPRDVAGTERTGE